MSVQRIEHARARRTTAGAFFARVDWSGRAALRADSARSALHGLFSPSRAQVSGPRVGSRPAPGKGS